LQAAAKQLWPEAVISNSVWPGFKTKSPNRKDGFRPWQHQRLKELQREARLQI
jgi:hypothetical protein